MPSFAQAKNSRTTTGRSSSWLLAIIVLGSVAEFNEMAAEAQTSLLDDDAPIARTTAPGQLSSPAAAHGNGTDNTSAARLSARAAGQDAETDGQKKNAVIQRAADQAVPVLGNPLWGLPLKQLSVTRERPIFSPSRRPPASVPTYVAPVAVKQPPRPLEPERPAIVLAGTIIGTDGYRVAFFRDTSTQDVLRLRMGENYHGWVVRLIDQREARLVKNGEQALLELPRPAGTPESARSSKDIMLDRVWAIGAD